MSCSYLCVRAVLLIYVHANLLFGAMERQGLAFVTCSAAASGMPLVHIGYPVSVVSAYSIALVYL